MSFNSKYTGALVEKLLDKIPTANDIWHTGNFDPSDYLPLKGGTITGRLYYKNIIHEFQTSDGSLNGMMRANSNNLQWYKDSKWHTIIHSGNIDSYNVGIATKLQTARTIWGQSFDGTGDINNASLQLFINPSEGTASWSRTIHVKKSDGTTIGALGFYGTGDTFNYVFIGNIYSRPTAVFLPSGNVGIGTTSPSYKLDVDGDIHASGSITQNSDINLKNISKDILISLDDISEAPLFEFTYKNDENKRIHVGTSAQYWVEKNNWFCKKQDNGYYDMEIQNLALASAISIAKEFKKYKEETESNISNMKKEIKELKQIILNMNK